jgi:hypothetical protein
MLIDLQEMRNLGMNQFDAVSEAAASTAKRLQAISQEATAFSKKQYEDTYALGDKLLNARGLDEIMGLQSDFAKSSYENFFAEAAKMSALCSQFAREAFKPAGEAFKPAGEAFKRAGEAFQPARTAPLAEQKPAPVSAQGAPVVTPAKITPPQKKDRAATG